MVAMLRSRELGACGSASTRDLPPDLCVFRGDGKGSALLMEGKAGSMTTSEAALQEQPSGEEARALYNPSAEERLNAERCVAVG